jgi:hypothetical protein
MLKIEINKADYDAAADAMVNALEAFAKENKPEITIDNDGIGGYEYWGCKGYDRGTNYAVVENEGPFDFQIDVDGCSDDFLADLFMAIDEIPFGHIRYDYELKINDVTVDMLFMVTVPTIENGIASFTGKWVDKN